MVRLVPGSTALPQGTDSALALRINDSARRRPKYRVQIFVYGWNTGQYVANIGSQSEFVSPQGFLNTNGTNTIALAVSAEQSGVGPDSVQLVDQCTVAAGCPLSATRCPTTPPCSADPAAWALPGLPGPHGAARESGLSGGGRSRS
ncbi:beta galactosidase jelly roll domain-containing protein [Streptomyces sp. NPDC048411]|uniref:beta galactosidase jelly roll domain-containing protein n=1 Tax=Streptomyces sp. NPDC048411 TaxID=3157206 RepID=UPI003451BB7E